MSTAAAAALTGVTTIAGNSNFTAVFNFDRKGVNENEFENRHRMHLTTDGCYVTIRSPRTPIGCACCRAPKRPARRGGRLP